MNTELTNAVETNTVIKKGVKKLQKMWTRKTKNPDAEIVMVFSFSEHGKLKVIVKYVEVQDYVNTIKLKSV
jgi:hypothetical protein